MQIETLATLLNEVIVKLMALSVKTDAILKKLQSTSEHAEV